MSAPTTAPMIGTAEEITPAWIGEVLGAVPDAVQVTSVGFGQIGSCLRVALSGEGLPASVLVKLPTADAGTRGMLVGAYRSEVSFYRDLEPTVAVDVPRCHLATDVTDDGCFTLVLEDLAPAEQGDQLLGGTPDQVRGAAENLAGLHGPRWCDPALLDLGWITMQDADGADLLHQVYGPAIDAFLDITGSLMSPEAAATVRDTQDVVVDWSLARAERFGIVHGDYRLDNLMFSPDPAVPVKAVDWQTLSLGLPAKDLAYLVATSLDPGVRREHERSVVAAYHARLVEHGVTDHPLEECFEDYRFAMLQGILVSVFGCAYGARTERGDRMFAVMVERTAAAVRELGTLDLL
ncbi:phosphotransferase [Nocardioides marmotae]|uniref:phosphotransferase n=1 Tax=Nocardioides marmotae TaxID=2663857 RepID=UPI0012B52D78|nr:phosphotransferase [Nocardioides marmotae]MBC9733254.1 phosphotransferase [Nocardioides marmotae]MTB84365.1 phosphotransferase [Nocardioides marmotae]